MYIHTMYVYIHTPHTYSMFLPFYYDDVALVLVPFVSVTIDSYDIVPVLV